MGNLGNAWHLPMSAEPRGRGGMRDPIGSIAPGTVVTIISGNQYLGDAGNAGNQLQDRSAVFVHRSGEQDWEGVPLGFLVAADNNKYFCADVATSGAQVGDTVAYYLRVAYDDRDTTFVHAAGEGSATTAAEDAAQASPFAFTLADPATCGQWGAVFKLPNVAIHAHVLPTRRVLMWGRRDEPKDSLDVHACTPFVWNPATGETTETDRPTRADGTGVNLFCSGHAFLPDGRLLVVGGHWADSEGLDQAAVFDPATQSWSATATMNNGRWYPTAITLADGRVLVLSGSYRAGAQTPINPQPQIWSGGRWANAAVFTASELYPRAHVASDGTVFMSGPLQRSWSLNTPTADRWTAAAKRRN